MTLIGFLLLLPCVSERWCEVSIFVPRHDQSVTKVCDFNHDHQKFLAQVDNGIVTLQQTGTVANYTLDSGPFPKLHTTATHTRSVRRLTPHHPNFDRRAFEWTASGSSMIGTCAGSGVGNHEFVAELVKVGEMRELSASRDTRVAEWLSSDHKWVAFCVEDGTMELDTVEFRC